MKKVLHKKNKSKPESKPKFGEFIAERTKLRKQRFNKIAEKEKTINLKLFKYYFNYQSKMYNALSDTKNTWLVGSLVIQG